MQMALDDAGISPNNVDYINAHGISTALNNKYETAAIEAIIAIKSIENSVFPATINYETPDPDCDLG